MFSFKEVIRKSRHSNFYRALLNYSLARKIPFNRPHGFKVLRFLENELTVKIPYKGKNLNHIKGLHACALATVSEFTTGLMLLYKLGFTRYRIIMEKIDVEYHYQGKMDATTTFEVTEDWLRKEIFDPLQKSESVSVCCEIKVKDIEHNHLSTARVFWQIKNWKNVQTKLH